MVLRSSDEDGGGEAKTNAVVELEVDGICLENEALGKDNCNVLSFRWTELLRRSSLVYISVEQSVKFRETSL